MQKLEKATEHSLLSFQVSNDSDFDNSDEVQLVMTVRWYCNNVDRKTIK